ncbi:fucose-1-phosphate guanylyltransferase-like isoform X1 [Macrobrachium nipponense]|uniref:fucose-1-phosphate guanylyltransferase-like isoform X1 n=2 Tax=Macrobrachium nipponense TaxID=159736 RepID=UPI0030C7DA80
MSGGQNTRIKDYMHETFITYNKLRSKGPISVPEGSVCKVEKPHFWDIVVLSTFDSIQKRCFEQQIDIKRQLGHFPDVPVLVVADPDGEKLGVGGSTLHIMKELLKDYDDNLYSKKILIIHSGGSSQRLPSYSVLGKIFTPVPCTELRIDHTIPQMLDLKFAMYLPFSQFLGPGVFITCADDIETYVLEPDALDLQMLKSADVVALAHPSDIEVGEGHGVYVFDHYNSGQAPFVNTTQDCKEVLQKPSKSVMRERGAVFLKEENGKQSEQVWSDSVFWLGERVCRKLLAWYAGKSPISSELDAYAHFLPCLGTKMKDAESCEFSDFRAEMLPIFKDCSFKVLLLNDSRFYHLGTMEEYMYHLTSFEDFISELSLLRNNSNCTMPFSFKDMSEAKKTFPSRVMVTETYFTSPSVKIVLESDKTQMILEYCQVSMSFYTSGNLILSNCVIKECSSVAYKCQNVDIFHNLLYHTVPITFNGQLLYVTVAFDLTADMKKRCKNLSDIMIFGSNLNETLHVLGYKESDVRTNGDPFISLWTAKLFMGSQSPEESFWLTHNAINQVISLQRNMVMQTDVSGCSKSPLFSMKDIIKLKALDVFIKDRNNLLSLNCS